MTAEARTLTRRLIVSALVLWIGAAAAFGVLRAVYGQRPAYIHVRWVASVDDARREAVEARYGLTRGGQREGRTWGYFLVDLSRRNIQALVLDPLVEDTHLINRVRYRVWREAPRGDYAGAEGQRMPWLIERLVLVLLFAGVVPAGLAVVERIGTVPLRAGLRPFAMAFTQPAVSLSAGFSRLAGWLAGRVCGASAEAVALFRVLFGLGVLAIVVARPVSSAWIPDGSRLLPAAADWLLTWHLAWGALFVVGFMARTSFVLLTAGVLAWASIYTTQFTSHAITALMLAMVCLVFSRWSDAWSVDAWLRDRRGLPAPPISARAYGYTIWVPGLALGVAFAAAAWAKLREGGLAWITNGTVKYHFLSDSPTALVDWGTQLGFYPTLAILVSLSAIVIEALVIGGALSRVYRYRAAAGVASLAILLGFALFQGVFWPAWWLLLLSFLPWHRLGRSLPAGDALAIEQRPGSRLLAIQAALLVLLVGQQVVVSALRLEAGPLFSTYDMYSTTYGSPAEYEEKAGIRYWIVAGFADGTTEECAITQAESAVLLSLSSRRLEAEPVLQACARRHAERAEPAAMQTISVEERRTAVDWRQWRLLDDARTRLAGPIAVARQDR